MCFSDWDSLSVPARPAEERPIRQALVPTQEVVEIYRDNVIS